MFKVLSDMFQNIEWSSIIIGAFLGAFIPVVAKWVWSLFKNTREKYHISLVRRETHTYKSMSEGDVSVNIFYKGKKYDESISIVEIGLVNDGLNDISFANHFDRSILIRSSSYKIIEVQNISKTKVKADVSIDSEGVVHLSWGLLKKDERIILRIVGVPLKSENATNNKEISFFNSLSLNVRSDCVDYIAPRRLPIKQMIWISSVLTSILAGIHYWVWDKNNLKSEVYTFQYKDNIFAGSLVYDKEADTYLIASPDSLRAHSNSGDVKSFPYIASSTSMFNGPFIFVFYAIVWLLTVLFIVLIERSDSKQNEIMVFEE